MGKIIENKSLQRKWYDKYLPFVAKSPQMQLEWLITVVKKKKLYLQEIAPYIKIFLTDSDNEKKDILIKLISQLDEKILEGILDAADIYDTPEILSLIPTPTISHALIALRKVPPPYEKNQASVFDKIFWALQNHSENFLQQASKELLNSGDVPDHFTKQFKRFQEIVEDEKILSALYPKARSN